MSRRHVLVAATVAASLAALLAHVAADALDSLVRELGNYRVEIPSVVPEWMTEQYR